jgi:hypothetical protein
MMLSYPAAKAIPAKATIKSVAKVTIKMFFLMKGPP